MLLIIVFTNYPFGIGEEFAEDEMREIWSGFDRIVMLSLSKHTKRTKFVPPNAEVVRLREAGSIVLRYLRAFARTASPTSIREFLFGVFKHHANPYRALRWIYIYHFFGHLVEEEIRRRIDREADCDILLYSYWFGIAPYAFGRLRRRGYRFRAVARAHGGDSFMSRQFLPFRVQALLALDELHFISRAGMQDISEGLVSRVPGSRARLEVSRLGVRRLDSAVARPSDDGVLRIVSCSSIIRVKRLDLLIEALGHFCCGSVVWDHFGDGNLSHKIEALAQGRLGQRANVAYHFHGRVSKEALFNFYESEPVDLFVNCSDAEGISVAVMEAFSYGIPALTRNVGGMSEIVDAGRNGVLLPEHATAAQVCDGLEWFSALDEPRRCLLRRSAQETFRYGYNAITNYRKFSARIRSGFLEA
jgi:glycosyltransferase involved in cell wall biosynthesis